MNNELISELYGKIDAQDEMIKRLMLENSKLKGISENRGTFCTTECWDCYDYKCEHFKNQLDKDRKELRLTRLRLYKAIEKLTLLIDIGYDYDGFRKADSLMKLIDELIEYAREARRILKGEKDE